MTEPTLAELREIARRTVTRRHHESEEGMLATAFLAMSDQLAAVTAERDAKAQTAEMYAWMAAKLEQQLADLQERMAEAPVGYVVQSITDQFPWTVLKSRPSVLNGLTRVRLVRDEQPQQEKPKNG